MRRWTWHSLAQPDVRRQVGDRTYDRDEPPARDGGWPAGKENARSLAGSLDAARVASRRLWNVTASSSAPSQWSLPSGSARNTRPWSVDLATTAAKDMAALLDAVPFLSRPS